MCIRDRTTAVRLIPVIGKGVGEVVEFGGLLGYAPIMPVNQLSLIHIWQIILMQQTNIECINLRWL